jgi:hypothetical protein
MLKSTWTYFTSQFVFKVLAREEGLFLYGPTKDDKYELILQQPIETNARTAIRCVEKTRVCSMYVPISIWYFFITLLTSLHSTKKRFNSSKMTFKFIFLWRFKNLIINITAMTDDLFFQIYKTKFITSYMILELCSLFRLTNRQSAQERFIRLRELLHPLLFSGRQQG